MSITKDFEGFRITVGRDLEDDTAILVSIDTRDAARAGHCHQPSGCPRIRVNINDDDSYDFEDAANERTCRDELKALYEWVENNVAYGLPAELAKKIDRALATP